METNFWTYLAVFKRRFWVILLLLAATMAVILGRAWTTPPAYQSSTVLQIIPLEPEEVTLYTRLNTVSPSDTIDLIVFQFINLVKSTRIAQQTLSQTGVNMPTSDFANGVSVSRDPSGDLVTVSAVATNPDDAEKLLQKQVDLALQDFRESRARPSVASGKFLETELSQAEKDLKAARDAVLQFKLDNHVESLDRNVAAEEQAIRDLNTTRETAQVDIKKRQAAVAELERQLSDAQKAASAAQANTPAATQAGQRVQVLQQQIADAKVQMASQQAQADAIAPLISERQANLAGLITLSSRYQGLADTVQEQQDNRDFLAGKVREAQLKESQSRSIGYLQVVTPPSTPRSQMPTRTVQTALLGAVLAIVAGAILIFVLEFIERTLRHSPRPAAPVQREQV
jgi:uncharacterized protein involved in exopolysaccharide biosynthesis